MMEVAMQVLSTAIKVRHNPNVLEEMLPKARLAEVGKGVRPKAVGARKPR